MSIQSRNWRSAEREAVVCQYTVDTGDQITTGYYISIHGRHLTSAEREVVLCQYTVETRDQPNGRL